MKGNGPKLMDVVPTTCWKAFRGMWLGQGDRRVKLRDLAKTESVEEKDIKSCQRMDFRPVLL